MSAAQLSARMVGEQAAQSVTFCYCECRMGKQEAAMKRRHEEARLAMIVGASAFHTRAINSKAGGLSLSLSLPLCLSLSLFASRLVSTLCA